MGSTMRRMTPRTMALRGARGVRGGRSARAHLAWQRGGGGGGAAARSATLAPATHTMMPVARDCKAALAAAV